MEGRVAHGMSHRGGQLSQSRTPGVAGVSAMAAPSVSGRSAAGHFLAVAVMLVALALAGAVFAGGRLSGRITDTFTAVFDAWGQQDRSLQQVHMRLQALQQQLSEWGALEEEGAEGDTPGGVLVIGRDQASAMSQTLKSLGSDVEALQRVIAQRQSLVSRSSEGVRRDTMAHLWALALGLMAAALGGAWWLARVTLGPMTELRRRLEVADQGQQALASALGPWFTKVAEGLSAILEELSTHGASTGAVLQSLQRLERGAAQLGEQAQAVSQHIEEFGEMADRIREFGGESRVLALSAAIEGARMEERGSAGAVIADELRRVASEARETVRLVTGLRARLDGVAALAGRAARDSIREAAEVQAQMREMRQQTTLLLEHVEALRERVESAGQAAAAWASRAGGAHTSLDLRSAVDRALSAPGGTERTRTAETATQAVEARPAVEPRRMRESRQEAASLENAAPAPRQDAPDAAAAQPDTGERAEETPPGAA